ncbi:hypothetical protein H310_05926 [Aphanomyces invadans]|uniref:Uncharacterized protein n=1 Tax=Aphanomyces invadans TaxID=157072 RepID=A0A024U7N5_9STRA|nr:hypothetical protein H310_05926 [Aphanomyces invadans]ETW02411.1 hypothetical protein H310_05926 [Aphanomyces invadans]|eukprot:XP_008869016.1 hypothetical protein H310_05926 [Aphanomyces invadans]
MMEDKPRKKRSRFSEAEPAEGEIPAALSTLNAGEVPKKPRIDPAALAKAAAAAISKQLPKHIGAPLTAHDKEKAREAAEKEARIQQILKSTREQISQVQNLWTGYEKKSFMPAPLLLDEQGRHIDADGNVIESTVATHATIKANISVADAQKEAPQAVNPYLSFRSIDKDDRVDSVDPRLKTKKRETRGAKNFNFVKQGTFVKQGEQMRAKEAKKMLAGFSSGRNPNAYVKETVADIPDAAGPTGDGDATTPAIVDVPMKPDAPVPEIEWWDIIFLPKDKQDLVDKHGFTKAIGRTSVLDYLVDLRLKHAGTSHLIEHPARIKTTRKEQIVTLPIMLTKAERKRIRRTTRAERLKETQDKIALGLLPPPEPKVKLANMMRVLQDQAVADPSAVERKVRAQVAQRELNHEMRNLARKLTPEERREKTLAKLKKDAAGDICVAVFKVPTLEHPQHKFKVDVNAQQLQLTGAVLTVTDNAALNLVVVEGGPKGIKAYVKLMCRRIDWSLKPAKEENAEDEDGEDGGNNEKDVDNDGEADEAGKKKAKCYLVWQGVVAKRAFSNFRFQECRNAITARKVLETKHVEQYWDMVESYNPKLDGSLDDDNE